MKGLDNREIRELFGEPELGSWGDRCNRLKSAGHILKKNLEKITKNNLCKLTRLNKTLRESKSKVERPGT